MSKKRPRNLKQLSYRRRKPSGFYRIVRVEKKKPSRWKMLKDRVKKRGK